MNENYKIKTDIKNHTVSIKSLKPDFCGNYYELVLRPKEEAIRDGLIKLGWTPPNQPDKPQPLSEGDWVIDSLGEKSIELIKKQDEDGVYHFMNLDGIVRMGYNNGRFSRYTLEEADLPDGCYFSIPSVPHLLEELTCQLEYCRIIIKANTRPEAISEALKIHIGQKLFERVGG